jgi:SAM-dependent methyltransferase
MSAYELTLADLHAKQAAIEDSPYLHAHSRNAALLKRRISIFERCQDYLDGANTVLDWGCFHGADACLVRLRLGDGVDIHGCDVGPGHFPAFFDFANLKYSQLTHYCKLPYENNQFDVVIGGGVLEHVPNDSESLKELYRVIRPGGHLIVTMLPNHLSYTECLQRILRFPHHVRRYSLREAKHMFLHHGFRPMRYGYHQMIPSLSSPRGGIFDMPTMNRLAERLFGLNAILERLPPLNWLSTNLFIVGRKEEAFHG